MLGCAGAAALPAGPLLDTALVQQIASALVLERPFPDVPNELTEAQAYAVQAAAVEAGIGTAIAGYKAGLTSAATQRRFGVEHAVLGVLPERDRLANGAALTAVPGLKIEVEIGFVVGRGAAPAAIVPVIELPRLAYPDMRDVTFADIVATDVGAYRFIAGAPRPPQSYGQVRELRVALSRDDAPIAEGSGADALGDPLVAYRWMVEQIAVHGYRLEPGMLLITGALGPVVDAVPGAYVARFGPLGELEFTIR